MTDDRELSDEVVKLLRARHEIRANQLPDSLDPDKHDVSATGTALTRELIAAERKFIHALLRDGKITDETRRRIERDLDLEEASLATGNIGGCRCEGAPHNHDCATEFAALAMTARPTPPPRSVRDGRHSPAASPNRSIMTAVRSLALLVTQAPERTV